MKRYFLACRAHLDNYEMLRSEFEGILRGRWSPTRNLHMTLWFFGTAYSEPELLQRLEGEDFRSDSAPLEGLGYFKGNGILFAAAQARPALAGLHGRLCERFGSPAHPLRPHVTLMRVKEVYDHSLFQARLAACEGERLGTVEGEVALWESTLHPDGARYRVVKSFGV